MVRFIPYIFALGLSVLPLGSARADGVLLHSSPALSLATPCNPGASCAYSWTLASRMGHILRFVEDRYGPRDRGWTLLGVEFTSNPTPQVWYPTYGDKGGMVIIQLTRSAATDETQALFQLSHEVVHLLSPGGPGGAANVLEEGLATYTSLEYLSTIGKPVGVEYIDSPRYLAAYRAVSRLAKRSDFTAGMRALRAQHRTISRVQPIDLQRAWPGLSGAEARMLAADF